MGLKFGVMMEKLELFITNHLEGIRFLVNMFFNMIAPVLIFVIFDKDAFIFYVCIMSLSHLVRIGDKLQDILIEIRFKGKFR